MIKKIITFIVVLGCIFSLSSCNKSQGYVAELSDKKEAEIRDKVLSDDNKDAKIYFYGQYDAVYVIGYTLDNPSMSNNNIIKYDSYVYGYPTGVNVILYNEQEGKIMPLNNYMKSKKLGLLEKEWVDEAYFKNIYEHFVRNHKDLYEETETNLGLQKEYDITNSYLKKYLSDKEDDGSTQINNYYGSYSDYQVVVIYSGLFDNLNTLTKEEVSDYTLITSPKYLLIAYKDGEFSKIKDLFEKNLITKDDLTAIYNQHKNAFKHLYLA